jgi:hypothetical protein
VQNNKGRFTKGNRANPTGKNGFSSGLAPYGQRAVHYLNKFNVSEIIAIAADPKKLDKYPSWDSIVIKRLAACVTGKPDERLEFESLLNRIEGKPKENKTVRVIRGWEDLTEEELLALVAESGELDTASA